MTFEQFETAVKDELEVRHKDIWNIEIHDILKTNQRMCRSLNIRENGSCVTPNIYLEDYYKRYMENYPLSDIVDDIEQFYFDTRSMGLKLADFDFSFEQCKDNIVCLLVSKEKNETLLKGIPHHDFLDLSIIYTYMHMRTPDGFQGVRVTNQLMDKWNITEDELYKLAFANSLQHFPPHMAKMEDVMIKLAKESGFENPFDFADEDASPCADLVILSNQTGINGAIVMAYPGICKMISEAMEGNFYILPSSTHEVIIMKDSKDIDISVLKLMVQDINRNEVSQEEFLSDNVYYYNADKDTIEY